MKDENYEDFKNTIGEEENDILGCMEDVTRYNREALLLKAYDKEFSFNDLTSILRFCIEHR